MYLQLREGPDRGLGACRGDPRMACDVALVSGEELESPFVSYEDPNDADKLVRSKVVLLGGVMHEALRRQGLGPGFEAGELACWVRAVCLVRNSWVRDRLCHVGLGAKDRLHRSTPLVGEGIREGLEPPEAILTLGHLSDIPELRRGRSVKLADSDAWGTFA